MEPSHLAFNIQVLSVPLVAVLLWQLTRAVAGRFLVYWTVGWAALAAALVCYRVAISADVAPHPVAGRVAFALYCCLEYVFGFFLWAGCRALTGSSPLARGAWVLVPLVGFGLAAPWVFPTTAHVAVFHAPLLGAGFLLSLWAVRGYRPNSPHPSFGCWVVRGCLLLLGVLFVHYGPVTYWVVRHNGGESPPYLLVSPMYNALAEVGLAFGMAILAIERVRDELEAKNRELAAAARSDPLTGLLNRRALATLVADWGAARFAGSVAVLDLNNLKAINDRHGHAAGDAAIQLVARALKGQFRITDPVFRTGGDEFLVVLVGGRTAEMFARMEALDAALKGQRLPGVPEPLDLVVAWGLAAFDAPAEIPAAIDRADRDMYACKGSRKAAVGAGG
jgi:diguanylate cyclase (GGDEF)-like protein